MNSIFHNRHFITEDDWSKNDLDTVFETSFDLKKRFALGEPHRLLQDKTLFMIFFEQSTRTRNSMEAGMTQLGGHAHDLTADKMQISHGESAKDTAIILSRMGHGIAARNCFYGSGNLYLNEMARHAKCPIMSLQDDVYHPFQGLADLMTIFEHFGRDPRGLKVTISWAYAESHAKPLSVPQTQILLFPRYGLDVTVAHPPDFPLSKGIVEKAKAQRQSRRRQADVHRRHGRGRAGGAGGHPQELGRLRLLRRRRIPEERGRVQKGDGRPPGQAQGLDLRPPPRQAGRAAASS